MDGKFFPKTDFCSSSDNFAKPDSYIQHHLILLPSPSSLFGGITAVRPLRGRSSATCLTLLRCARHFASSSSPTLPLSVKPPRLSENQCCAPLRGAQRFCAVWASPSALLHSTSPNLASVSLFALRGHHCRSFVTGTVFRYVPGATSQHQTLRSILVPYTTSLCEAPSFERKSVLRTSTRSAAFLCGVGFALRLV